MVSMGRGRVREGYAPYQLRAEEASVSLRPRPADCPSRNHVSPLFCFFVVKIVMTQNLDQNGAAVRSGPALTNDGRHAGQRELFGLLQRVEATHSFGEDDVGVELH